MIIKKVLQNTLVGFLLRVVVAGLWLTDGTSILANTIDDWLGKSPRRVVWIIATTSPIMGLVWLDGARALFVDGELFSAVVFLMISLVTFWLFPKAARKL